MRKALLLVNGWPSKSNPGRMAFFYTYLALLGRMSYKTDVYIIESVFGHTKRLLWRKRFVYLDINNDIEINTMYVIRWPLFLQRLLKKPGYVVNKPTRTYDIVWAHFLESALYGYHNFANCSGKWIYTEHSSDFYLELSRWSNNVIKELLSNTALVYGVSDNLVNLMKTRLFNSSIKVLPNSIDIKSISSRTFKKRKKKELLFVGHLIPRKGILDLVKVFLASDFLYQNFSLTIIGDGPQWDSLSSLVADHRDKICLKGAVSNDKLRKLYSFYDILVLPSKNESFGVVVIEALAAGLPCVVTNCGGPEYIIEDERLGEVLPVHFNQDMLKFALNKIIVNDKDELTKFRREYITNKFDISEIQKVLEHDLQSL